MSRALQFDIASIDVTTLAPNQIIIGVLVTFQGSDVPGGVDPVETVDSPPINWTDPPKVVMDKIAEGIRNKATSLGYNAPLSGDIVLLGWDKR